MLDNKFYNVFDGKVSETKIMTYGFGLSSVCIQSMYIWSFIYREKKSAMWMP